MYALRGSGMEKGLCWAGTAVGGILLILFLADFILKIAGFTSYLPFGGLDYVLDVICAMAAGILLFLSLNALKDVK
jgi:hypothetical protein